MNRKPFNVLFLFFILIPLSNSNSQPLFDTWTTYWTGHNASSVFVDDLNGDGHLDLAVTNGRWNAPDTTVSILINNGNGTFSPKMDFVTAHNQSSVFGYDIDADGDIDLVTASGYGDSSVSILKNNGNGTFSSTISYRTGSSFPITAWLADLDGDGDGDLITGGYRSQSNPSKTVSVLKNNGDGTFAPGVNYLVGNNPRSTVVSDIDGDGDQDILTANIEYYRDSTEKVSILKNNGDGTFAAKIGLEADSTLDAPYSLCASDLDGDGDQDLAVAVARYPDSSVVSVFKNDGAGNFSQRADYVVGHYPHYIYAADLDGDGDDDLAVAFSSYPGPFGEIAVLKNNSDGTFAPRIEYPTGELPVSIVAKDIDGDGSKDIISASYGYDGGASILKNKGDGTFPIRTDYSVGANPHGVIASDLDGDGDNDLGVANAGEYSVSILTNNGNGAFQPKVNYNANGYPASIFSSDIDGDGDRDLLTAQSNTGSFSVLKNDGNAAFNARTDYTTGLATNLISSSDLDLDGDQDVVITNNGNYSFSVFVNDGNGVFGSPTNFPCSYPYGISLSDFDLDGDPDLAMASGWIAIFKNNGDGTFGSSSVFPTKGCSQSAIASDLDGDGDRDLATTNDCQYGNISVVLNNGDGSFAANTDYDDGPEPSYGIAAADMNGDGNNDLIITNYWTRTVSIFTNKGNGVFDPPVGYGVGAHPYSVTASDLDGDGDNDLAVTNDSANTVSILINQTNTCITRGDLNRDCVLTLSDIVMQINCIFQGLGACSLNLSDTNCDGLLTPLDVVLLLNSFYLGTPLPCP